MEGDLLNL